MSIADQQIVDFVIREARLIDERRFDDWLALFARDGVYWMPLEYGQTEERLTTSLMYEDRLLLETRVRRLAGERTFSQQPKSRCQHVLQRPMVDERDDNAQEFVTYTPFSYFETRGDEQTTFAGTARHRLAVEDGALKIKMKRVDLINCDAAHRNIQLFI